MFGIGSRVYLEVCQCKKRGRCLIDHYYFEVSINSFQATILIFCSTDKTHKSPPFKQKFRSVAWKLGVLAPKLQFGNYCNKPLNVLKLKKEATNWIKFSLYINSTYDCGVDFTCTRLTKSWMKWPKSSKVSEI